MRGAFILGLGAVCATLAGGCVPAVTLGVVASSPTYQGYHGQGFYSETPPGTYYGSSLNSGPFYGGGSTATVVRADVYRNRTYLERDQYKREGRRYYQTGKPEFYRERSAKVADAKAATPPSRPAKKADEASR